MRVEQKHYDVAVVGGGMAGASAALELQALGLKVVLIEQANPCAKPSTCPEQVVALSWGTVQHLKHLQVWQAIESQGVAALRNVDVSQAGQPASVQLLHHEEEVDALGFVVQNQFIVQALYQKMQQAKVAVICPAKVLSMSDMAYGKQLRIRTEERDIQLQVSLLVGADGTYSQVRNMAGILSHGWDHNRFALVASVTPEKAHQHTAYECFRSDGPLAFLPLDDKRFSIVWTLKPSDATRMLQASDMLFLSRLNMAMGEPLQQRIGRIVATSKKHSFFLELRISQSYTAHHMLLIGNAARTLHPVAGQGMNLTMRDVVDLRKSVQWALTQQQNIGHTQVLAHYAALRKKDQRRTLALTEGLNVAFNHQSKALQFLNQGGLKLLSKVSFLRHRLSKQAAGLV